jgi:hypothetical protein
MVRETCARAVFLAFSLYQHVTDAALALPIFIGCMQRKSFT